MKLTRTTKRASGMTLLELTVVILVLLSLISILFIGARAWKAGSDRAGCIMNLRNVQQAIRSHQNMRNLPTAGTIAFGDIVGGGLYIETPPVCPAGGTYSPTTGGSFTVAAPSTAANAPLAMTCTTALHVPDNTAGW